MARQRAVTEAVAPNEVKSEKALAAPKDLRAYLKKLIEHDPKQLLVVAHCSILVKID